MRGLGRLRVFGLIGAFLLLFAGHGRATVTSTYTPVQVEADGNTTNYTFSFKVFNTADVLVQLVNQTSLVATNETLGSDYNVTLSSSVPGGTVIFSTPPAATYDVYIARNLNITQSANIPSGGLFRERQIENALDKNIMILQELQEKVDRAVLQNPYGNFSTVILPSAEAGKALIWGDNGTLENTAVDLGELDTLAETVNVSAAAAVAAADSANSSATIAAAAAASLNLPTISISEAGKQLQVNDTGTGYEFVNDDLKLVGSPVNGSIAVYSDSKWLPLPAGVSGQVLQSTGTNATWANQTTTRRFVGSFTYDVSSANGTVAYTGVGFTPSYVTFTACLASAQSKADGMDSNTSQGSSGAYASNFVGSTTYSILGYTDGSNWVGGAISAFTSDGFNVTYTKTGSPSGTMSVVYTAFE